MVLLMKQNSNLKRPTFAKPMVGRRGRREEVDVRNGRAARRGLRALPAERGDGAKFGKGMPSPLIPLPSDGRGERRRGGSGPKGTSTPHPHRRRRPVLRIGS